MNPASRILSIVNTFGKTDTGHSFMVGWKRHLGLRLDAPDHDAWPAITAALREIEHIERRLAQLGAPPELFAEAAAILREVFSPALAPQAIKGYKDRLLGAHDVRPALRWADWALAKFNDEEIDPQQIEAIRADLDEQERRLKEPGIPFELREMLERQVHELRAALRLYTVQGPAALHSAVSEALGEIVAAPPEVKAQAESNAAASSAAKGALEILGKTAKAADDAVKVAKFTAGVYNLGTQALPWIKELLKIGG